MAIDKAPAFLLALSLTACTVGPDYKSSENLSAPTSFNRHGAAATDRALLDDRWWLTFNDPALNTLVDRMIAQNLDIATAEARLAQSRAQAGITAADQFPQVNGNASFTRQQPSENGAISLFSGGGSSAQTQSNGLSGRQGAFQNSSISQPFNLWQNGFDASWEIDFWGRVRRRIEAAGANVEAALDAQRQVQIIMIAELARDYVQLRGTQAAIDITRQNLATTRQSASLAAERAKGGLGNELDVQNAQAQVDTIRSQLGPLEQREGELINQLGFLIGEYPGALRQTLLRHRPIPAPRGKLPIGVPADLVRRRPDVQQADAQLHAAVADIGAAQADFFPRLTLAGSAGLQSIKADNLYDWRSGTYSFGPSVTLPIFQGGRLQRTVELRNAQEQEAALGYKKTVLQAFHDVDNALIALQAERRRQAALSRAVASNQSALSLANKRYTDGLSTFLDVLTTQSNLLQTQQQLTDSRVNVSTNIVRLYKALGGGWETNRIAGTLNRERQQEPAKAIFGIPAAADPAEIVR